MVLTVLIGSLASFAMGRMRLRKAWLLGNLSLVTYAVPASFLVIPFTRLMHIYGLTDNLWAVIAARRSTFATPYAILIFHQYGKLIPLELDDAARVDGASPFQVYWRIYLPLMAPALAAVATYALLLAWNEYLYQYLLLSSPRSMTVAAAINQFFDSDEAPWNYLMAVAIVYLATADRGVLRAAPLHGGGSDDGWRQGIAGRFELNSYPRRALSRNTRLAFCFRTSEISAAISSCRNGLLRMRKLDASSSGNSA